MFGKSGLSHIINVYFMGTLDYKLYEKVSFAKMMQVCGLRGFSSEEK